MSSGPEVHPMQAKEYDPPGSPTAIMLVVGAAILVVIVFALEVLYAQFRGAAPTDLEAERRASPAARLEDEQVGQLEAGQVPFPEPPEPRTGWRTGKTIDAAMDAVVEQYRRGS